MPNIDLDVDPLLFLFGLLDGSGKIMRVVLLSGFLNWGVRALRGSHPVRRRVVPVLLGAVFWLFLVGACILGALQRISRESWP